jgi:hypothetical protein
VSVRSFTPSRPHAIQMVVHAACSFFLSETSSLLLLVSLFTVRLKSQLDFAFTELARSPICAGRV